jgi:hypothetical protein
LPVFCLIRQKRYRWTSRSCARARRKTYQDQLVPTPQQERELGRVLGRVLGLCRSLHTTAFEQRITAYRRSGGPISRYQQEAELKEIHAEMPR